MNGSPEALSGSISCCFSLLFHISFEPFINLVIMFLSSAPFSSVTTYKKDYIKKTCPRPPRVHPVQEYKDPLAGPLEEHILPYCKLKQLPQPQTKYPDPREYAEEVAEKYPSTRIFLRDLPGGPPDFDVIDRFYEDENRTIYMVSYCERGDYDSKKKRGRSTRPLPPGWVIPLTTQRRSYRNPAVVSPEGISKMARTRPKNNLAPNEKEREILQVKTGETIYISDISNTGMEIIKGKLHGDVDVRPKFDQDELLRAKMIRRE